MTSPVVERHDPSRPYAEQYRIDAQQFTNLYRLVSPWTCGEHTDVLAQRIFRLLDENMDQLIEFKGLASCLGISSFQRGLEYGQSQGGGRWVRHRCYNAIQLAGEDAGIWFSWARN